MRNLLTLLVLLSLAGAAHAADFAWWKDELPYRVPVVVKTAGVEESDAPAQVRFNFSAFLPGGEQLDLHSVRVVDLVAESGAFLARPRSTTRSHTTPQSPPGLGPAARIRRTRR